MLENVIVKKEQEKLDQLNANLKIGQCTFRGDEKLPIMLAFNIPLKGNSELIKKLEGMGWERGRRSKKGEIFWLTMEKEIFYRKYAIYQTSCGLRATDYIENKEDLLYLGLSYIREDSLPVIVNRKGGYTSFYEEYERKKGFLCVKKIPEDEEPLTREQMYPKNAEDFLYGWIDRAGNTYSCGFEWHYDAAESICRELGLNVSDYERELERLGWLKLSRPVPYNSNNYGKAEPYYSMSSSEVGEYISTKQYEKLCELGYGDCIYLDMWRRNGED